MQEIPTVVLQRKAQLMKHNEFLQLRSVLPTTSNRNCTSPIDVIEEAIKYIAYLQATLEDHDNSSITIEEVQQEFREASPNIKSHIRYKERRIASFHARLNYTPKPRTLRGQDKRTKRKQYERGAETTT